ncbi:hypothetical protein GBAR_LOCUS30353, partial [Geodia barretti]
MSLSSEHFQCGFVCVSNDVLNVLVISANFVVVLP